MKKTNRNKIVISTLLATVLIGAGAIKVNSDTIANSVYLQEIAPRYGTTNTVYDDGNYAQEANEGNPDKLNQQLTETKGDSSNWFEYKTSGVQKGNAAGTSGQDTANIYSAVNYHLVDLGDETTTIGGFETNQYYSIGIVFDNLTHKDKNGKVKGETGYLDTMYNYGSASFMGELKRRGLGNQSYDLTEFLFLHENPDGVTTSIVQSSGHSNYKDVYADDENFYVRVKFDEASGSTSSNPIYQSIDYNISEEDWHKQFDNDERTLFGADTYDPNSHLIVKLPIKDNPLDSNLDDSFGLTQDPSSNANDIFGIAVSDKDVLALSRYKLVTNGDIYSLQFGGANESVWKGDWETSVEHAMPLSYPKPKFEITPKGYNDRNEYEVEVLFDHLAVPTNYDIINEISYVMMGPKYQNSAVEDPQVIWDQIIINDKSVTRNKRTSIEDPTLTTQTWDFTDPNLPEGYKVWTDGDLNNGGDVNINETPNPTGAKTIFETNGTLDGETATYNGDIELAGEEQIVSTIKYEDLFYATNEDDLAKTYSFYNTIQIAPTAFGNDNAYLGSIDYGNYVNYSYSPIELKLIPDSATPTIDHFDVVKPEDISYVDPKESIEISFSGDTKSTAEDTGVGLKRTYLNAYQIVGYEIDTTGKIVGDEILLTDVQFFDHDAIDSSATGAFDATVTTKPNMFTPNRDYRISLRTFYGNGEFPTDPINDSATLKMDYLLDGEYVDIHAHGLGDKEVKITNNVVSYDPSQPELGATVTFDYSQTLPADAESGSTLDQYDSQKLSSASVVNNAGTENEEILYTVNDLTEFDYTTDQTGLTMTVPADKLLSNKEYNLSTRVETTKGVKVTSESGSTFVTASLGAYKPTISSFTRENEIDVEGGVTTDFKFSLKQQIEDQVNISQYSKSDVSKISFVLGEQTDGEITTELININTTDNPDRISIPSEDVADIEITGYTNDGEQIIFDTTKTYGYKITVEYDAASQTVEQSGTINFELKGISELDVLEDVKITSAASTLTSFSFDVEINDVAIAAGYDSFAVKSIEVLDAADQKVDAKITWKDADGNVLIDGPVDTEEGVAFTGKASILIKDLKSETLLSDYKIKITTDSINLIADGTEENPTFDTEYVLNVMELIEASSLIDGDGNLANSIDQSKEFMDIKPLEHSDIVYGEPAEDSAMFWVTFEDDMDLLNPNGIVFEDTKGNVFSSDMGNLIITPEENTKAAGQKVYRFEMTNLTDDTTYSEFTMTYVISEEIEYEGEILTSTSKQQTDLTDLSFTTLPKPDESHFPWWIIILLLLTLIGILILLVLLFLRSVRVVSTTETTKGSTTFVVNRDNQSGFLDTINGAKLEATQNGKTSTVEYKTSVNADSKVAITLTGITNDAPIKGLKFIVDQSAVEASNAKVEAANKSLEDKFAKENEAYQAAVKTWEENKAKAIEAGKEFTDAKPAAPAKPALEKLAKPNKDVKVIGSVKTALEDSSNKEEPKKPATEEKPAAKKTTTATTAAKKPAVKKPTEAKAEEENKSATGSAEIIY